MQFIGLSSVLEDKAFQDGLKRYSAGVGQMETLTDKGASVMSKAWAVGSAAVTIGAASIVAGIAGIAAISKTGLDALTSWNNEVNTLSDNLGTTGEQSSAWAAAFAHVGLTVDEGAAGLNFFTKNLDNLKTAIPAVTTTTTKLSAEALAGLNQRLDDAKVRLERAQKVLAEAKKPTDQMRYAVDDAQKAIGRLNEQIAGGSGLVTTVKGGTVALTPFQLALKTLGVNAFGAGGKLKTFDELMPTILDSFQKMPAGIQKSALAMDLFGARAGTKFLDFLSQGSEGLEKARKMAQLYGLEIDTDMSNAVEDFGFAINDLNLGLKGFWVIVGKAVLPVAVKFVNLINDKFIPPLIEFAKFIAPKIASAMETFGFILEDFFDLLGGNREAVDALGDDFANLGEMLGLSASAVGTFAKQFAKFIQSAISTAQSLFNVVKLLATGDFTGGIFGLTEDDPLIDFLFTAREGVQQLFEAFQKGDWGQVASIITDGLRGVGDVIVAQVKEWAPKVWIWTVDALALAGGKINEFVTGVGAFLAKNGPGAWTQLTAWASDFWNWLSGPDGAISKAFQQVLIVAMDIAFWFDKQWTDTIQPALADWGAKFWEWLTGPKEGAIVQAGKQIEDFAKAFAMAANEPEAHAQLERAGFEFGKGIFSGANKEAAKPETGSNFVIAFIDSIGMAGAYMADAGAKAAIAWFTGFRNWFTTDEGKAQIRDFLLGIVLWSKGLTIEDFNPPTSPPSPQNTLPLGPPAPPVIEPPTLPTAQNFTQQAAFTQQQVQAIPLNLTVQIGTQQISEAIATWSAEAVSAIAQEAVAQIRGTA